MTTPKLPSVGERLEPGHDAAAGWHVMSELARAIAGYKTLEQLFHDLSGRLHEFLNFTYLSVVLHDPDVDAMRVWQIEGAPMPPFPERPAMPIAESPSGLVWETQQLLYIPDTLHESRFTRIAGILAGVNVRSFISLPLTTVQRRLGALNFGNATPGAYAALNVELPMLVASHIAVAVDNALHADSARALANDLSQRNRELSVERERLQQILREIPGVVWEIRRSSKDGKAHLSILNEAASAMLGRSRDSLTGSVRAALVAVHPDDRRALVAGLGRTYAGRSEVPLTVRAHHTDGSVRWIELRATPLSEHDTIAGLRGVALDVTSRVQAESQRRQHAADLATERFRERARIASELHDTLLQSAVGSSLRLQAFASTLAGDQPELQVEIDSVLSMLDEAIRAGRMAVQGLRTESDVDLASTLQKLAERMGAGSSGKFRLEERGTPGSVHRGLVPPMCRVASEALTNAFRHSAASNITATIDYGESALIVRIQDNGVGIEPGVALRGRDGHLGIIAMRERVTSLGGSIEYRLGSPGTLVEICLPVTDPGEPAAR